MMENVFLHLLNMSLTAAVLVLVVLWLRVIFHRAPRWIHCLLWALVAVRLVCPFTIESNLSLMPENIVVSAPENSVIDAPQVEMIRPNTSVPDGEAPDSPVTTPDNSVSGSIGGSMSTPVVTPTPDASLSAPTPEYSADPWQIALAVATYVWLVGMAVLAVYAVITTLRLRRKVGEAAQLEGNLWHCDHIRSPFILGVFRPRIYLPSDLSGAARDSVIAHEQAHLRRRDHWWKPLGFLLLTVYWFNPLMWVAYILLCRDIEAACDERVVRDMTAADRKAYSEALLSCSAPRRMVSACPLAFGETSVKSRIKSVLSYKKPTIWIVVVALLVSTVAGVCLLTDPKTDDPDPDSPTVTDEDDTPGDPDTQSRYATFTHNDEPRAKVTLELGGNRCTYINSIVSSAMPAEGTYEMGEDTVTLTFPDEAMTIVFDGDLTGLTLRLGQGGSRMSYEQMSYGDRQLTGGAVFARVSDDRTVSFAAPLTFSDMNWLSDEKLAVMREKYQYRTGDYSDKDLPIIPITSRAELDAFIAEYKDDFSFDRVEDDGLTPVHQMSFYDDAFFAEKQLLAVYYKDSTCSVRPQIAAVDYNGEELVTVLVDVYEPYMHQNALGQWFMLAEVARAEIADATAYRAWIRSRIPTDYYWATYSHPYVVGGEEEPAVGKYRLEYDHPNDLRQLVESLNWYGADTMADTAFFAMAYFSFDGQKRYYVDPSLTTLYDGEQIADLTADQGASLDYLLRSGVPTDAATASVSGTVVEWNKEGGYLLLEVTESDSKLSLRVKVYTGILSPGSAPAVGYSATIDYDGWYETSDDYSVIYALSRKWLDADLLGGPDDDTTPTGSSTATTTTTKPTTGSSTGTPGTASKPTAPTNSAVTSPYAVSYAIPRTYFSYGVLAEDELSALYRQYAYDQNNAGDQPVIPITSREQLESFIETYKDGFEGGYKYPALRELSAYGEDFFADKMLLAVYYYHYCAPVYPQITAIRHNGKDLVTVEMDIHTPEICNDAFGNWFVLAEVPRAQVANAAFRAVVCDEVLVDYGWNNYSHPVCAGTGDEFGGSGSGVSLRDGYLWQMVPRLNWYGADTMMDTDFTAVAYFTFDGQKRYYVSADGKMIFDGERIADLTAEQAAVTMSYISYGVAPVKGDTYVTGKLVEWNKEGRYMTLEVTKGDAQLGERVRVYTNLMTIYNAPTVGDTIAVAYDGYFENGSAFATIYGLFLVGDGNDYIDNNYNKAH